MRYCLVFILLPFQLFAQTVFKGTVKDKIGTPLQDITVNLYHTANWRFLSLSKTNEKGEFTLIYKGKYSDSLAIKTQSLAYLSESKTVFLDQNKYDFVLEKKENQLEELIVKSKITKKKDTLSYNVEAFTELGDRTLADVMKRIPGLNVSQSGRITFEGKPIENYYIEGLNLLGGRYGLANNNLLAQKVERIEILQNHQSTLLLEDVKKSDKTSINIKLKNKYTLTAPVSVGIGYAPFITNLELIPMLFSPKKQFLGGLKANNTGKDINLDLIDHNATLDFQTVRTSIVSVLAPALPEERFRFNKSAYGSINNLNKLKNNLDLKLNLDYLYDELEKSSVQNTIYTLSHSTVQLQENNQTLENLHKVSVRLDLNENSKKKYFNNTLKIDTKQEDKTGIIKANQDLLSQNQNNNSFSLSNNFSQIFKIQKQIINLSAAVSYKKLPQKLSIATQNYIFPFAPDSQNLLQEATDKKLDAQLQILTFRKFNDYTISFKAQTELKDHDLESDLWSSDINIATNRLKWKQNNLSLEANFERNTTKTSFQIGLPIKTVHFFAEDKSNFINQKIDRLPFEPFLNYKIKDLKNLEISTHLSRNYTFGTIENIYYGAILRNYKQLMTMNAPLPENISKRASLRFKYNQPFTFLNTWLNLRYHITDKNIIYSTEILPNGSSLIQGKEHENSVENFGLDYNINYKIQKQKLSFAFQSSWNNEKSFFILNQNFTPLDQKAFTNLLMYNLSFFKKLNLEFMHQIGQNTNQINDQKSFKTLNQNHSLNLKISIKDKQLFWCKTNLYTFASPTENLSSNFIDLGYQIKLKTFEIEGNWQNILNINSFQTTSISSFTQNYQSTLLRPSQVLLSVRWSINPKI